MLGKFFDRILHEAEELIEKEEGKKKSFRPPPKFFIVIVIFLLALIPRLIYLFLFTDPQNVGIDWYGDVYHHWQIAWLSKEIGFEQGFLRLWDFKGLEFYWGLLHPLLLTILFGITGSISIVIPRLVSAVFGAGSIALIFLIVHKHFGRLAAWGAAIFSTFLPVTLFSETLGMQEPLGLFFLLLGIYILEEKPFFAGMSWMLAGMVRSEYWVFGAALLLIELIRGKLHFEKKIALFGGFGILLLFYMKYMLTYTGSAIFPIKIAYLATYKGDWFLADTPTEKELFIQAISRIIFFVSIFFGFLAFWKRPKAYLFFLFGLGNIAFISLVHGYGARILGWIDNTLVDRMLSFPYEFLGVVLAISLLYYFPKVHRKLKILGVLILLSILLSVQPIWLIIEKFHVKAMQPSWERELVTASAVAENWDGKGNIIFSSGRPGLTYTLSYFEKIPAQKLVGDFYSPFYYYEGENPFEEWRIFREELVDWLEKTDAEIFVYTGVFNEIDKDNFARMLELESGKLFELEASHGYYKIYKVKLNEE